MEDEEDYIVSGDEIILLKPPRKIRTLCKCKKCPFVIPEIVPSHFTEEDVGYCCRWCRLSHGNRHGNHCEKKRKFNKKKHRTYNINNNTLFH